MHILIGNCEFIFPAIVSFCLWDVLFLFFHPVGIYISDHRVLFQTGLIILANE